MRVRVLIDKSDSIMKIVGADRTDAGVPCSTALEVVRGGNNYIWITHDQSQTRIPNEYRKTRSLRKLNHMVSGFYGDRAVFVGRKISHFLQRLF
ncbi:MAG: hypothetical protein QW328_06960 [Nitrososphaerota archaeon]